MVIRPVNGRRAGKTGFYRPIFRRPLSPLSNSSYSLLSISLVLTSASNPNSTHVPRQSTLCRNSWQGVQRNCVDEEREEESAVTHIIPSGGLKGLKIKGNKSETLNSNESAPMVQAPWSNSSGGVRRCSAVLRYS